METRVTRHTEIHKANRLSLAGMMNYIYTVACQQTTAFEEISISQARFLFQVICKQFDKE